MLKQPLIRNATIAALIRSDYTAADLSAIEELLRRHQILAFKPLATGLFSAAAAFEHTSATGYHAAWVRDNVHVLNALWRCGDTRAALRGVRAICRFYYRHHHRISEILGNPRLAEVATNRPHIRFCGDTLDEFDHPWAHAQNDALGYFLWLWAGLAKRHWPRRWEMETVAGLVAYLEAIRYWEDEDSGHWEENRKISASSIGAVVAGLRRLMRLPCFGQPLKKRFRHLRERGEEALKNILPMECNQPDPEKRRPYDAALVFLIEPLRLFGKNDDATAERIAADVTEHLLDENGICRYLGDSFYCTNYETNINAEKWTTDYSDDLTDRDGFFQPGGEARWAIFDPMLSVYFGRRWRRTGDPSDRRRQVWHFNRSLGQITGEADRFGPFHCPELYYMEQGRWQTSRSTPLLWTQANLMLALREMRRSLPMPEGQADGT